MFEFHDFNYLTDGEIDLIIDEKVPANDKKGYVPAYKYFITLHNSKEHIGFIDIRIGHNKNTYYGGNIGYTIYEPFRGHHYAAKACNIIKQIAIYHNMTKLYITCDPDNIPSRKTCEKLGLEFKGIIDLPEDNEMYLEGEKQKCLFEWKL